eukprot:scaffold32639_cov112-Isochrysis_galbana.AAC.13
MRTHGVPKQESVEVQQLHGHERCSEGHERWYRYIQTSSRHMLRWHTTRRPTACLARRAFVARPSPHGGLESSTERWEVHTFVGEGTPPSAARHLLRRSQRGPCLP